MNLVIILLIIVLLMFFPIIEHAATSPATLMQLSTSSTSLPYGSRPYAGWYIPRSSCGNGGCASGVCGGQGRPEWQFHNVRPVMQRGVHFGNPSWTRL